MHILILEPYDDGSHKYFLDGLTAHSRHTFTRVSLPGRKWKWRMRGSAIYFARILSESPPADLDRIDLIFTCDMTSVADLRGLLPDSLKYKPIVCYFHENQLTYPLPNEDDRDYQYGFTNITSCLASDAVWFNSRYHRDSFLAAVESLLRKMPDYVPAGLSETIVQKSRVMPLGIWPDVFEPADGHDSHAEGPPVILWNHRWEYDKNPDEFFEVLFDLDRASIDFRLIVAGQTFREAPPVFAAARKTLAHRIDHFGYVEDRQRYLYLLRRADIVVSTAIHEFFGLSVLEAVAAGCRPLLPNRLSYPELFPPDSHKYLLYKNQQSLRDQLTQLCQNGNLPLPVSLVNQIKQLNWRNLISIYDHAFENMNDN
ncbi:MAG: DUF3524 domain-containing protein [Sedimentisphaerales bacterium]|nr:DUF3524 domain-containing protein [Sedimentisphaerales bacterium]